MVGQVNGRAWQCVLVDLNTQRDFLEPTAVCRVRNGEQLLSTVRRVVAWAKWNHVPVISAVDAHRHAESTHDGFPLHCIDGTRGQGKIPWTLFGSRVRVEADNTLSLSLDLFESHQQVIFRKRTHDLFSNPKADRFLTQLRAEEFILGSKLPQFSPVFNIGCWCYSISSIELWSEEFYFFTLFSSNGFSQFLMKIGILHI